MRHLRCCNSHYDEAIGEMLGKVGELGCRVFGVRRFRLFSIFFAFKATLYPSLDSIYQYNVYLALELDVLNMPHNFRITLKSNN